MNSTIFWKLDDGRHWRADRHIDIRNRWWVAECCPIGNADHEWRDRFAVYADSKEQAKVAALLRLQPKAIPT
jgi:hypothetical protein